MKIQIVRLLRSAALALALCGISSVALASPYASGLTNNAGTISFRLNEPADNVKVISSGGATTNDLGALPKGITTTNLGISGAYQIVVTKAGPGGWTQSSNDTNNFVKFNSPRGVAVNTDPSSPYFGRVYVANSATGTTASRPVGDGIYVLNPDLTDAVGQGDTARTGGLNFTLSTASSPYRITIGQDNNLYICDWADASGNLYVTDPDVTDGLGQFVLKPLEGTGAVPVGENNTHGSIAAAVVTGKLATGDLHVYTIDEDLQTDRTSTTRNELNSLWQYDLGAGPLPSAATQERKLFTIPNPALNSTSQTMDLARGTNGYFYISDRRANGNEPGVYMVDSNGTNLFDSLTASLSAGGTNDFLIDTFGIDVSPDGKYLAALRNNNVVTVVPLTNGIPDMTKRIQFSAFGATVSARDIAFDAANNLYVVSSGFALLRAFSQGGTTVATTDSSGTFSVSAPEQFVSVSVTDNSASESGSDGAAFVLTRSGDTTGDLLVVYTMSGTASNGVDYTLLSGSVTIPAGSPSVGLSVTPVDDSVAETSETIILSVIGGTNYSAGIPGSATANLRDNEAPQLFLTALQTQMYERIARDYVSFRITRRGDTNVEVTANLVYSGSATNNLDFTGPLTVTIPAGTVNQSFTNSPLDDSLLEGSETFTVAITNGAGYTVATNNSATATILDDELPTENVIFTDNFDRDSSGEWVVRFGANNAVDGDYLALFGYDYSADGIPAAPNTGGATTGLKVTVNKFDATAAGAAGINLYPTFQSFSNNFALRFSMYLALNSGSGTTENAVFGINHSGNKTNWVRLSTGLVTNAPLDSDGLWFTIVADGSEESGLSHVLYTGTNANSGPTVLSNRLATSVTSVFKQPTYTVAGSPGGNWVDVEVSQIDNVVTLKINQTVIIQKTNTTPFASGDIMLGYNDPFDSIGGVGAVIYDNVRVVSLPTTVVITRPNITGIRIVGGNVQIDFSAGTTDAASAFTLVSAGNVGDV